jgi:hypothetical protein
LLSVPAVSSAAALVPRVTLASSRHTHQRALPPRFGLSAHAIFELHDARAMRRSEIQL